MARLKTRDRNIPLGIKLKLQRALVISIMPYACEPWTLNTEQQRRIQAVEMRCLRRLLDISYKDRVTNNEVRGRGHSNSTCLWRSTVPRLKRGNSDGHVTRSEGSTKTVQQGTVQGKKRQGRQKKSWADNILEWTGKSFAVTQTIVHNCTRLERLRR
ncbi:hypothetical protein RRG08_052574 [Elysia crispata]|uniref:Endonuclease-reverse transcriptase n=1 Tax=Elysia crispata TaxID=231223 RepID=A0AAE1A308_9GAST|nr:hypothetical protein RRG08_052574 [Elysia crispata]